MTQDVEAEIRSLEERRLRSLVDRDLTSARELHADDYQLITPIGMALSKEVYLGQIERGEFVYEVFEAESEVALLAGSDMAVARYRARISARGQGWQDTGTFWHTDVYAARDGRWLAVWSQATRIPPDVPSL